MMLRPRKTHVSWLLGLVLCGLSSFLFHGSAGAQSIVVLVNDEPITSYDVAQRQRFLALTGGLGNRMRARLQSDETKQAFREFMMRERPASQAEAQELQKKFVQQVQRKVVADSSRAMRKEALKQLIDKRLMLQAARDQKISVSDKDVEKMLTRMAQGGSRKLTLKQFLSQFSNQGINPSTLRNRIRAQTAWRQVIRRLYGSRVRSSISTVTSAASGGENSTIVDVQAVKLAVPQGAGQKVMARRLVEAEKLSKRFKNCAGLSGLLQRIKGASVKRYTKAKLTKFRGDVRAAIRKGRVGQMTPPVIVAGGVETHAICSKKVSVASGKTKKSGQQDELQKVFQLYSRRHLRDLKDHARLDYPKKS
jgi:peptidyl-prolyl cis-trans isomerase SurA